MNNIINLLKSHRSIRKFSDKPVDQKLLETIIEAGQSASTSRFIQACTVIQVNDPDSRAALYHSTSGQMYVKDAPVFIVFCADMQRHRLACNMHDSPMLSGFTEQMLTASLDCALFAQNVMIAAESLGLGGCYIGAIRNNIADVDQLLDLPDLVFPVFGMCLGYPGQNPETKPRLPLQVVFKQEKYDDNQNLSLIKEYDQAVRTYYQTRTGGNKDDSWSRQISEMLVEESRPHMLDYLKSKGFITR